MHCTTKTNMLNTKRTFLQGLIAISATIAALAPASGFADTLGEALRIHVNGKVVLGEADLQNRQFADPAAGMAAFKKNIVTLRRNESTRLKVETVDAQGRTSDVTAQAATTYQSLAPSRLSVSADGVVTAAPTPGAPLGISGDLAVLVVFANGGQEAWNKVFFNIVP